MSVCLETTSVLASQVSTSSNTQISDEASTSLSQPIISSHPHPATDQELSQPPQRTIAKLSNVNTSLPKTSLITVLNTPLSNVKTLCVTPTVSNVTGQFTVVNSTASLNVANAGKPQTITLINTPVTVVKTISPSVDKTVTEIIPNNANTGIPTIIENRGHNVFVKNTSAAETDIPQSHKLLTATSFPSNNVLATAVNVNDVNASKTNNGQRNKVKILSNVLMPGTSQNSGNLLLKKPPVPQRYISRQKIVGPNNGVTTKYLNKPTHNLINKQAMNSLSSNKLQRVIYPTHKSQIKTLPPVHNYSHSKPGIKTLSPHPKGVLTPVQRTSSGLRTIPPQRPQKVPNKPNYIGKHAVQAQKLKQPQSKFKGIKPTPMYNSYHSVPLQEKQMTFNQALTAEILETLSNKSGPTNNYSKSYEILPPRYDNAYYPSEVKPTFSGEQVKPMEEKTLDALSLICQAVLLDHNYNATLPPDSPPRTLSTPNANSQMNGVSSGSMYSPGRSLSISNPISSSTSLSTLSTIASNSNSIALQDDDVASDISDVSDRKNDTEGEETDTAPEAEAVNNEDQFGDYVTRCICGFIHDDGYMIECDRCKVWQHVQCVVKNKQVPEDYLCEICDPRKHIDRQKARMAQQQWLRDRQFLDPKLRKDQKFKDVFKNREVLSDSDSSDAEQTGNNNNVMPKGRQTLVNRRKSDSNQKVSPKQRRDSVKEIATKRTVKKRERRVVRRKTKTQHKLHSDEENHESTSTSSHLPQLRQWIENYEEAVTNHYSPELRARISNIRVNGAHTDVSIQFDPSVHKCRVHTQPLTDLKYLVSLVHLPPNSPIIELRGKYMLSAQHRNSGNTFNTRQHAQRPGPFLFFYRLHKDNTEVCVDTRTYGNSARFIRRSCKPNAELRHTIVKGVLHLYIVTIANVDKNVELTIKHESHDLAAIGTTTISCACGNSEECTVNRTTLKKNGDTTEMHKKRRGRRTVSVSLSSESDVPQSKQKKEVLPRLASPSPLPPPQPPPIKTEMEDVKEVDVKQECKTQAEEVDVEQETVDVKQETIEELKVEHKKEEVVMNDLIVEKPTCCEVPTSSETEVKQDVENFKDLKQENEENEEEVESPSLQPVTTRRSSSHQKVEKEESQESESKEDDSSSQERNKNKKLSREERKLEAILRAIAQMEKADQRKQEHQAKQAHRRESEPGPGKEEDKIEPKLKRRRRKGRARTASTHTPNSSRRNRLNSTDSYLTSGDEILLSPTDNPPSNRQQSRDSDFKENNQSNNQQNCTEKDVGLLLALSNGDKAHKSPPREIDSNSNSVQSSPETHVSSTCLLVQAAVEPMEQGFKFPKTKKVLMNEWLNKVPDQSVHSVSSISPSSLTPHINTNSDYDSNVGLYTPGKSLVVLNQPLTTFCDTNSQPRASAKKRWLRQAIREDQCDSPSSRPETPPLSETLAPPKKRRLPRESLSNEITPPSTPTSSTPQTSNNDRQLIRENSVDIAYNNTLDDDSPSRTLEVDSTEERTSEPKDDYQVESPLKETVINRRSELSQNTCLMDPRLQKEHNSIFSNSEHLLGTVERTLSILGFEDRKPEPITPAKRKLSITEYRQRKKLNNNDKLLEEPEPEHMSTEENTSESFKPLRQRSDSTSSCTSITSSDDEGPPLELTGRAPAFNSEPTELERQRELTSLRLKKVFGISIDDENRKPALDVQTILNCELPSIVKTIPPSPNFPIPGSCDLNASTAARSSPIVENILPVASIAPAPVNSPIMGNPVFAPSTQNNIEKTAEPLSTRQPPVAEESNGPETSPTKSNLFYTPDEDEKRTQVCTPEEYEEIEPVDYVPPFNNPIYPNDNDNFPSYASGLDEDGRYEGRNPSPPPDLEEENASYSNEET